MNGKVEKFEDLLVWKAGMQLAVEVYSLLKDSRDFGLRDQLQRSAVSIPSNIAEGFERQTNKEFIQFLYIAKGSCGELRTQVHLLIELGLIQKATGLGLVEKTKKISAMLYSLINTRKERFV
jgi:four helix bundle protein